MFHVLELGSSILLKEGSVTVAVLSHVHAFIHASWVLSLLHRDLERGWICRAGCASLGFSLAFSLASALLFCTLEEEKRPPTCLRALEKGDVFNVCEELWYPPVHLLHY